MNVKDIRRENARQLAQSVGGITALSERLGKTQAQISHTIGKRPLKNIGDRFAFELEQLFNKPYGWLDKLHAEIHYTKDEIAVSAHLKNTNVIIHWLPLIDWHQILKFSGKLRDAMLAPHEKLPTCLDVSKHSFAVRVEDEAMKTLAGIEIQSNVIFIIDGRVPPQEQSLVCVFNHDRSQVLLQKYQTKLSTTPTKYKLDPHRMVGVVRQVMLTM